MNLQAHSSNIDTAHDLTSAKVKYGKPGGKRDVKNVKLVKTTEIKTPKEPRTGEGSFRAAKQESCGESHAEFQGFHL